MFWHTCWRPFLVTCMLATRVPYRSPGCSVSTAETSIKEPCTPGFALEAWPCLQGCTLSMQQPVACQYLQILLLGWLPLSHPSWHHRRAALHKQQQCVLMACERLMRHRSKLKVCAASYQNLYSQKQLPQVTSVPAKWLCESMQ